MSGKLLIARHGESEWNAKGVWTGTTDVHLTPKGLHEAELLGQRIRDVKIDKAFYSEQVRSLETLKEMLKSAGQPDVPVTDSAGLNERDYGIFTGKNKWQVQKEIGEDAFNKLRRGWNEPVEGGETLKMVYERSTPFYKKQVLPLLQDGQNVLIVAHGNSIRSLMKYIESLSDEQIEHTEMIFGKILIYTVDTEGKKVTKQELTIKTNPPAA